MRSKIFSSDYMRASSKGQIWIPAFLSLGFLMAFPVLELLMMGNWFGMNYESAQVEQLYEGLWRRLYGNRILGDPSWRADQWNQQLLVFVFIEKGGFLSQPSHNT